MTIRFTVTGPNGSMGKHLARKLNVMGYGVCIQKIDYSDTASVRDILGHDDGVQNIILHTAFKGVLDHTKSTEEDYKQNMRTYHNIKRYAQPNDILINFGSGIIDDGTIDSFYKKAKKEINHDILTNGIPSCLSYDIVMYGLFDASEDESRFVSSMVKSFLNGNPGRIHVNRDFSFASYDDVFALIAGKIIHWNRSANMAITIGCRNRTLASYAHIIGGMLQDMGEISNHEVLIEKDVKLPKGYFPKDIAYLTKFEDGLQANIDGYISRFC